MPPITSRIIRNVLTICRPFWIAAVVTPWETVVPVGDVVAADVSGGVTNPDTEISREGFSLDRRGVTTLKFRLGYAGTPDTPHCVIRVWGRTLADGQFAGGWKRLYNKAATPTTDIELTANGTADYTDGIVKYTADNPLAHSVDVDGCDEFVIEVYTEFTVSAGSAASAFVQVQRV